jgi:hypothetical protein
MLSALHSFGMRTARSHLGASPQQNKATPTSWLGQQRNKVCAVLLWVGEINSATETAWPNAPAMTRKCMQVVLGTCHRIIDSQYYNTVIDLRCWILIRIETKKLTILDICAPCKTEDQLVMGSFQGWRVSGAAECHWVLYSSLSAAAIRNLSMYSPPRQTRAKHWPWYPPLTIFFSALHNVHQRQDNDHCLLASSIMTSSPPDIASLSLSSHTHQRLNENYDYEGNSSGNERPHYHFSTSPPVPSPSQYNPLGMSQSPLKKATRSGLPTVSNIFGSLINTLSTNLLNSNGLRILLLQIIVHCLPIIIQTFLHQVALLLRRTLIRPLCPPRRLP